MRRSLPARPRKSTRRDAGVGYPLDPEISPASREAAEFAAAGTPVWSEGPARGAEPRPRQCRGCDRRRAGDRFEVHGGSSLQRWNRPVEPATRFHHPASAPRSDRAVAVTRVNRPLPAWAGPASRPLRGLAFSCPGNGSCVALPPAFLSGSRGTCPSLYLASPGERETTGIGMARRREQGVSVPRSEKSGVSSAISVSFDARAVRLVQYPG
jgi:hypothetical protein